MTYCHIISQDHEISHVTLWVQAPHEDILWIVCPHPAKYGWLRHCGSGDLMFLVLEERNSTCSRLNPPLLFICYSMLRSHTCQCGQWKRPILVTRLLANDEKTKKTFASLSKKSARKEEKKKMAKNDSFLRYTQTQ